MGKPLDIKNIKPEKLGLAKFDNPLVLNTQNNTEQDILYDPYYPPRIGYNDQPRFTVAITHPKIFFSPQKTKAAIATCGGICPGLNNVIRSVYFSLKSYGTKRVIGYKYGFQGFIHKYQHETINIDDTFVEAIHNVGGTTLGTSRGSQDIEAIVDTLEVDNINQLYLIGGDGTLRAAKSVAESITKRDLKIAVVGIPKTIDNDIEHVTQSFGFNSAVEVATAAIRAAKTEASSSHNGVGLVKLMGRDSGFIAATAAVAQRDVNIVLIPEVPFVLEGQKGLFNYIENNLKNRGQCVIVVAEGAGQELFQHKSDKKDLSGNLVFNDIGLFLKEEINEHFKNKNIEINLKYIDPSYLIRSVPANSYDKIFAATLGQHAVNAAMAGYTNVMISIWHGVYCYVPIELAIKNRKQVNPNGTLWTSVLQTTKQFNVS